MLRGSALLPRGRHFALTWGIPDQYGGMTSALLHRSRAFRRLGGVDVGILTLDDRPDYPELEQRLLRAGELVAGVRIRNLWDDLRQRPPRPKGQPVDAADPLEPHDDDTVVVHEGVVLVRERRDAEGRTIAVDRFRRDGTLLATDRLVGKHHRIVVHGLDGSPLRAWASTWRLYRWWLDRVTGGRQSFLLVDSKTAARFVTGYRRAHVVTVHVVHGAHRDETAPGELRSSREYALRRAEDFDAIVVLTRRQRDDLVADGVGGRLRVIPNGVALPRSGRRGHAPAQGVMLASLTPRKRVADAVEAAVRAHAAEPRVVLDVYGDGEDADAVRRRIAHLGAEDVVRLRGHDPHARESFQRAGFSLLTSSSEGLPLVLVESMGAGCIPIAYDIRYGPADMIRDGRDGFLVAEGDIDAMASRIVDLQRMPHARLEAMRRRARARAREFSDAAITRRWARELHGLRAARSLAAVADAPRAMRLRRRAGLVRARVLRFLGR